jgi:hypothetical protein
MAARRSFARPISSRSRGLLLQPRHVVAAVLRRLHVGLARRATTGGAVPGEVAALLLRVTGQWLMHLDPPRVVTRRSVPGQPLND